MRIIIAIAFFSQWSGNGLVSYYLNKVFDTIGITDPTIQVRSPLINQYAYTDSSFTLAPHQRYPANLESVLGLWRCIYG